MQRLSRKILITSVLLLSSCSGSPPKNTEDTHRVLADLEQQLLQAVLKKDKHAYDALLAPDWTVIDVAGRVLTKQQVMQEMFGSDDRQIEQATIDDVNVRPFGDTAVVTGRTTAVGSYRDVRSNVVLRFTDVFAKRDGRWQVVASQGTAVLE